MPRSVSSGTRLTTTADVAHAARPCHRESQERSAAQHTIGVVLTCAGGGAVGHGRFRPIRCAGMVTTAITAASTKYVPRQPSWPASRAVIGANIVLASPPAKVSTVSAATRLGPYQRVSAANAGG